MLSTDEQTPPETRETTAELSGCLPSHRLDVEWKGVPLGERRKAVPFGD